MTGHSTVSRPMPFAYTEPLNALFTHLALKGQASLAELFALIQGWSTRGERPPAVGFQVVR